MLTTKELSKSSHPGDIERSADGTQEIVKSIDDTQSHIADGLGLDVEDPRVVAATDDFLVDNAERQLTTSAGGAEESVRMIAVESVLELDGQKVSTEQAPILDLEAEGYIGEVSAVVAEIQDLHWTLPSGEDAAVILAEKIDEFKNAHEIQEASGMLVEKPSSDSDDYWERVNRIDDKREQLIDSLSSGDAEQQEKVRHVLHSVSGEQQLDTLINLRESGVSLDSMVANGLLESGSDMPRQIDEMMAHSPDPARSKELLMQLLKCDGLNINQPDSDLFTTLTTDPEEYGQVIDIIAEKWDGVRTSGFPPDVASSMLADFSTYTRANPSVYMSQGKSFHEYIVAKAGNQAEAIALVGGDGFEAYGYLQGNDRKMAGNRGFADQIALRVWEGEEVDKVQVQDAIKSFASTYRELTTEQPWLVEKIKGIDLSGHYANLEDRLEDVTTILQGMGDRVDALQALLPDQDASGLDNPVGGIVKDLIDHAEQDRRELDAEKAEYSPFHSLDVGLDTFAQEPRYGRDTYVSIMRSKAGYADKMSERILNPRLRGLLDDERDAHEVNQAIGAIMVGDKDVDRAIDVYGQTTTKLNGVLVEILRAQPSAYSKEAVSAYYDLLPEAINQLDKNGTPYNSPGSIARVATYLTSHNDQGKAIVEWYRQDDLPLAAFDAVIAVRERVVSKGVEDSPGAIYEHFCQNNELIAEMSSEHLSAYISGELSMVHSSVSFESSIDESRRDEVIAWAKQEAERRKDSFRIFLNISTDVLVSASHQGGTIKSIMDTDVVDHEAMNNRGLQYVLKRSEVELMMGNRSFGEDEHPIYGSAGFVDRGIPTGAFGYGNVMLTFRPDTGDLSARTTYTPEDSFHGTYRLVQEDAMALRLIKNGALNEGWNHAATDAYVEAQITGGVALDHVETIYADVEETADRLRAELPPELAAKVRLRPVGVAVDVTSEKSAIARFAPVVRSPESASIVEIDALPRELVATVPVDKSEGSWRDAPLM